MSWFERVTAWMRGPSKLEEGEVSSSEAAVPVEPEMAACGHLTLPEGEISAHGETTVMTISRDESGRFPYCLDCVAAMSIRCAWCEDVIFVGSPVTLYTPVPDFAVPDYAVVYSEDPLRLVGCLGWNCATTLGDRAGYWVIDSETGNGYVHRVPTAWEHILGGAKGVINNNVSDPNSKDIVFYE